MPTLESRTLERRIGEEIIGIEIEKSTKTMIETMTVNVAVTTTGIVAETGAWRGRETEKEIGKEKEVMDATMSGMKARRDIINTSRGQMKNMMDM
ncbi:hypothetical protein BGX20_007201, partial [Mortierella sp. AD010]